AARGPQEQAVRVDVVLLPAPVQQLSAQLGDGPPILRVPVQLELVSHLLPLLERRPHDRAHQNRRTFTVAAGYCSRSSAAISRARGRSLNIAAKIARRVRVPSGQSLIAVFPVISGSWNRIVQVGVFSEVIVHLHLDSSVL